LNYTRTAAYSTDSNRREQCRPGLRELGRWPAAESK